MKLYWLFLALFVLSVYSCKKSKKAVDKPELIFTGFSHETIKNGDPEDTLLINLRYTVALNNLGSKDTPTSVYYRDSRDINVQPINFPNDIYAEASSFEGSNIRGNVTLRLQTANITLRPDRPNGDTLQYIMYLQDKYGNKSDTVVTSNLYIVP